MKVAGIQFNTTDDIDLNFEKVLNLTKFASEQGAKIICFPELACYPWFPNDINDDFFKLAEKVTSDKIKKLSQLAKEKKIVIIYPFFETENSLYYNSAAVIDANGKVLGVYRKIHLPLIPHFEEKYYFKKGNLNFPIFKTQYGNIAVQIGWDVFFPEVSRIYALKEAEIIFTPTASAFSSQPRWLKVISSHALFNTVFICRINRIGKYADLDFYGGSFCVEPDGGLLTEPAGENEGIILWDINLNEISEVRRLFPFLKDRDEKEYFEIIGYTITKKRKKK